MANRSYKLTPKSDSQNQSDVGAKKTRIRRKRIEKKQGDGGVEKNQVKKTYKLSSIIAIAILLSSVGLVLTSTWLGVMLIFNPEQVSG